MLPPMSVVVRSCQLIMVDTFGLGVYGVETCGM